MSDSIIKLKQDSYEFNRDLGKDLERIKDVIIKQQVNIKILLAELQQLQLKQVKNKNAFSIIYKKMKEIIDRLREYNRHTKKDELSKKNPLSYFFPKKG